jgi:inosine-uridine nucleoside N-ribohydrolase
VRRRNLRSMTKVLLDTDIGTDVDDAVCLAYLLAQPECELLGITTVTGEAEQRASLASVLCMAAGKEIPIYPGAESPLSHPPKADPGPAGGSPSALGAPHQTFPKEKRSASCRIRSTPIPERWSC